jgi:hypothetical protein
MESFGQEKCSGRFDLIHLSVRGYLKNGEVAERLKRSTEIQLRYENHAMFLNQQIQ